jgi:guanylate kinase
MASRIIIVGRGGSGKDYLRKKLQSRGIKYQISYTTRPPRPGEVNGVDYHFITPEEADRMAKDGEWYEAIQFNGWTYGTSKKQFYDEQTGVLVMTPSGLQHVSAEDRKTSFVIYINPPADIIEQRLRKRDMPGHTVEERIAADNLQFADFKDYDIMIENPYF